MNQINKPLLALIAIIVIVSSLISIYLTQNPRLASMNLLPFEAVGDVVAEETMKRLPGGGKVVLVVYDSSLPAMRAPVERFLDGIERRPDLEVIGTEKLAMDLSESYGPEILGVSGAQFLKMIGKHRDADLVISFVGAPNFNAEQQAELQEADVALYVVSSLETGVKELLESGLVDLAIIPRYVPAEQTAKAPKTRREWFDRLYMIATPASATQLP